MRTGTPLGYSHITWLRYQLFSQLPTDLKTTPASLGGFAGWLDKQLDLLVFSDVGDGNPEATQLIESLMIAKRELSRYRESVGERKIEQ